MPAVARAVTRVGGDLAAEERQRRDDALGVRAGVRRDAVVGARGGRPRRDDRAVGGIRERPPGGGCGVRRGAATGVVTAATPGDEILIAHAVAAARRARARAPQRRSSRRRGARGAEAAAKRRRTVTRFCQGSRTPRRSRLASPAAAGELAEALTRARRPGPSGSSAGIARVGGDLLGDRAQLARRRPPCARGSRSSVSIQVSVPSCSGGRARRAAARAGARRGCRRTSGRRGSGAAWRRAASMSGCSRLQLRRRSCRSARRRAGSRSRRARSCGRSVHDPRRNRQTRWIAR